MGARLSDFLNADSIGALEQVRAVAPAQRKEIRPPPPQTPPLVYFPTTPPNGLRLERLKIDRVHVSHRVGSPCPCCTRPLKYQTVIWPGGDRPPGGPESAWFCGWCRQYYVYMEVPSGEAQDRWAPALPSLQ